MPMDCLRTTYLPVYLLTYLLTYQPSYVLTYLHVNSHSYIPIYFSDQVFASLRKSKLMIVSQIYRYKLSWHLTKNSKVFFFCLLFLICFVVFCFVFCFHFLFVLFCFLLLFNVFKQLITTKTTLTYVLNHNYLYMNKELVSKIAYSHSKCYSFALLTSFHNKQTNKTKNKNKNKNKKQKTKQKKEQKSPFKSLFFFFFYIIILFAKLISHSKKTVPTATLWSL